MDHEFLEMLDFGKHVRVPFFNFRQNMGFGKSQICPGPIFWKKTYFQTPPADKPSNPDPGPSQSTQDEILPQGESSLLTWVLWESRNLRVVRWISSGLSGKGSLRAQRSRKPKYESTNTGQHLSILLVRHLWRLQNCHFIGQVFISSNFVQR